MEKLVIILVLTYALLLLPTWLEAFVIDPYIFWDRGKDDKPLSTYIRGVLLVIVGVVVDVVFHYGHWYWAIGIATFIHIILFAFFVNIKLNKEPGYLGSSKYDMRIKKIPLVYRLIASGILLAGFIIIFEITKY